jgi:chromate transporter
MNPALETFLIFLRLGFTAFGGPLAHTAMFEDEFVKKRKWLTREEFLHHLAVTQMIPGPNSTELSMHLGHARAGWPGFFLAGFAFITPAVVMVILLGMLYVQGGGFQGIGRWVWGTKPVVAALIAVMIVRTGSTAFRPFRHMVPALFGFALYLMQAPMWTSLMAAAGMWLLFFRRLPVHALVAFLLAIPPFFPFDFAQTLPSGLPSVPSLFAQFLYLGSMVLGSGYVLFSLFSSHIVDRLHWFDANGLAMAIAAGQLTPGPLFASAAFFGQVLQGIPGAIACTVGIFLPAFVFGGLSIPLMKKMEKSEWWKDTMKVLGALCVLILSREAIRMFPLFVDHSYAYAIFFATLVAYGRFRVNTALLVGIGALVGAFVR